jgi:hypothetical protein
MVSLQTERAMTMSTRARPWRLLGTLALVFACDVSDRKLRAETQQTDAAVDAASFGGGGATQGASGGASGSGGSGTGGRGAAAGDAGRTSSVSACVLDTNHFDDGCVFAQ